MNRNDFHLSIIASFCLGVILSIAVLEYTKVEIELSSLANIGDFLNPFIAIVAISFAIRTWKTASQASRTEHLNSLLIASYEVVLRELRDRKFVVNVDHPIPGKSHDSKNPSTLREAKGIARSRFNSGNRFDQTLWDSNAKNRYSDWTSDIAFATGDSLQQLGFLIATGAIPLRPTLIHAATAFVDDWLLCAAWIKTYQNSNSLSKTVNDQKLHYHRRHAEWLALLSIAYLRKYQWDFDTLYNKNEHIPSNAEIQKRLIALTKLDLDCIPADVLSEIQRIIQ